jgi:hypothetical protein
VIDDCKPQKGETVAEREKKEEELTPEELEEQDGEPLPDREAMSVVTPPGADGIAGIVPNEPWVEP